MERRFPGLVQPRSGRLPSKLVTLRQVEANRYREILSKMPEAELEAQYQKVAEEERIKAEREELARPFNQPYARAKVEHWAKMSYWTPDEAVALSLGREPRVANWPAVQKLGGVSPFAAQFASRREIVIRAKAMGQLWDYTIPTMFLAWAERMRIEVPQELVEAVSALGKVVADRKRRKNTLGNCRHPILKNFVRTPVLWRSSAKSTMKF